MHLHREEIIGNTLNGRLVNFDDGTIWRLIEKLSEKPWEGSVDDDQNVIDPYEAHAVYECEQVTGNQPGKKAIIKVRIEYDQLISHPIPLVTLNCRVPELLDPDEAPADRAKHGLGMQLGSNTQNEIEQLQRLTKAGSKITPTLLAVRIEQQDETLMWYPDDEGEDDLRWWMPGGYVVYILMEKIPALGLTHEIFWELEFAERQAIRESFRKELM